MTSMKITLPLLFAITILTITNLAAVQRHPPADPGWPRQRTNEKGSLVYYQPQVDAWTNFKELDLSHGVFADAERWERDHRRH